MKLAIGQVPPLWFVLLRLLGSVMLIAPALLASGGGLMPVRGERATLFWVGQLQVAGFLILSIIGLSIVPAGRAIVLAYTMPLWAIPIGLFLWPEPIGRMQFAGAAIGFAGLVLFMNPALIDWGDARMVGGNALLLAAAIGMCALLVVVGIFGATFARLPKSGMWMVWVKRVLALVMLGAAEYYFVHAGLTM